MITFSKRPKSNSGSRKETKILAKAEAHSAAIVTESVDHEVRLLGESAEAQTRIQAACDGSKESRSLAKKRSNAVTTRAFDEVSPIFTDIESRAVFVTSAKLSPQIVTALAEINRETVEKVTVSKQSAINSLFGLLGSRKHNTVRSFGTKKKSYA